MQTYLIVGGNEEERVKEAEKIIGGRLSALKNNPDFSLLQTEENSIGIAEVRNLLKELALKPFQEAQKTVLIFEAQNLTTEAQNALLKTLEEPPPLSKIILTAPDTSFLLSTIVSRCQIVFLPISSLKTDDQKSRKILDSFKILLNLSPPERLEMIEKEKIAENRKTAENWLNDLTVVLRNLFLSSQKKEKTSIEDNLISQYPKIISSINKTKNYLKANGNVRLGIEVFVIDLPGNS